MCALQLARLLAPHMPAVLEMAARIHAKHAAAYGADAAPLERINRLALLGASRGVRSFDGDRSGPAFSAHLRLAAREEILRELRPEPEAIDGLTPGAIWDELREVERVIVAYRYSLNMRDHEIAQELRLEPHEVAGIRSAVTVRLLEAAERIAEQRTADELEESRS